MALIEHPFLNKQAAPALLIVISGPSGVGKDSILMALRARKFPFHFVVTATSRSIRPGEQNGYDYHFVTRERFEQFIAENELIEWAEVYGQYKGVPKFEIRQALESGKDVILRVDVQGAASIRKLAPDAILIFVAPSDLNELRERLEQRHTEAPEEIEQRLEIVRQELQTIDEFDYLVINRHDHLEEAVDCICAIVKAEKQRVHLRHVRL